MIKRLFGKGKTTIPVLRLEGVIGGGGIRGNQISFSNLRAAIDKAFQIKAPFVVLLINSPGGSPVQSALIGDYLRQKADQHETEIYAFCEDVAASGGYWLAASGDRVYAMSASIIGSIGVISAMFGYTELIKKIGIERRVYTAGKDKAQLDPFLPEDKKQIAHLKEIQKGLHQGFVDWVKARRGKKLSNDKDLFTGNFWEAGKAKQLGLIDEIQSLDGYLYQEFGKNYQLKIFDVSKQGFLKRLFSSKQHGVLIDEIIGQISERLNWEQYRF